MSTAPKLPFTPMTSDEFLLWSLDQPHRYELVDGIPVKMQSERVRHSDVKGEVFSALRSAILRAGLPCRAWPDGVAIRISDRRTREPDAAITCGVRQDPNALALEGVIAVVEVLSPTTDNTDKLDKLADYGAVPGLSHYLIVHPAKRYVIHHKLGAEPMETRVLHGGNLVLDPPGLLVPIAELFPPEDEAEPQV